MCDQQAYESQGPLSRRSPSAKASENARLSINPNNELSSVRSMRGPSIADMNLQMSFSEHRSSGPSSGGLGSLEFNQNSSFYSRNSLKNQPKSRRSTVQIYNEGFNQTRKSAMEAILNPTPEIKIDVVPSMIVKPINLDYKVRRKRNSNVTGACRCKASKCLKLYCECFAKGQVCSDGCHCKNCHNISEMNDLREMVIKQTVEKNPYAFKVKYKPLQEQDTLLHSRGCNCSKTFCIKNYCECFNAGIGCSRLCKCINCKNKNISITDEQVKVYHERVLRKRRKKASEDFKIIEKYNLFKKIHK